MKMERRGLWTSAFSLVEFLVIILVAVALASIILPALQGPRRSRVAQCLVNLMQDGFVFNSWAMEHGGKFPWQVSSVDGGAMESAAAGRAAPSFQLLSNHLGASWLRHYACPTDRSRKPAASFAELSERNISYFISLDSFTNSSVSILAGDRHLQVNGQPAGAGLLNLTSNVPLSWTRELHGGWTNGVILFTDGRAKIVAGSLGRIVEQQALAQFRFVIP